MERNEAIEKHYIEQYSLLVKRMYNRTKDVPSAEDIVQEAFARALKYWAEPDNLEAWFNILLNNAMRDFIRSERISGCSDSIEGEEDWEAVPVCDWAEDMLVCISEDIKRYPKPTCDILFLYFEREFKPREIHEILGEPNGTIRNTIGRFRQDIKYKYKELGDGYST